jgi:hypothetical protein
VTDNDASTTCWLDFPGAQAPERKMLVGHRVTVGRNPTNDIVLDGDSYVSSTHAILERVANGWSILDLTSRNGTYINGERISSPRILRTGDELRIGRTCLRFESAQTRRDTATAAGHNLVPSLTARETEVLLELCRPLFGSSPVREPASTASMAELFGVSEAAIKQILDRLYKKFEVNEEKRTHRRSALAVEAVERGAVTSTHYHANASRLAP